MMEGVSGMKALLLDKEVCDVCPWHSMWKFRCAVFPDMLTFQTTAIVSMVINRSQVLEKEVFLFQRIDAQGRGEMLHLKAIVFLRPTRDNIELLAKELMSASTT
jgi:hypothetical protein